MTFNFAKSHQYLEYKDSIEQRDDTAQSSSSQSGQVTNEYDVKDFH